MHGIGGAKMAEYGFRQRLADGKADGARPVRSDSALSRNQVDPERSARSVAGGKTGGFHRRRLSGLQSRSGNAVEGTPASPTVHFIGPQIWAWRGGRIKKIAKAVSHMLVVFPFEEAIYRQAGIPVTYVGHPLAEVIPLLPDMAAARAALELPPTAKVVAILPGSRMSELKYNTAAFIGAAKLLAQREPGLALRGADGGPAAARIFRAIAGASRLERCAAATGRWPVAYRAGGGRCGAGGVRHRFAGSRAVQEADGDRLPDDARFLGNHAPHGISAVDRVAEYPGAGISGAGIAAGCGHAASSGRRALAATDRCQPASVLRQRFTEMHHALLRNTARESAQAVLRVMASCDKIIILSCVYFQSAINICGNIAVFFNHTPMIYFIVLRLIFSKWSTRAEKPEQSLYLSAV